MKREYSGKPGDEPVTYRQFFSYGFLRVKRWDSERGEYVQIGSFAGPDAVKNAEERIADDKRERNKTMKREYTPGPWEIHQDGPEAGNIPDLDIFADGYKIATVIAGDALLNGPDSDQNPPGDYEEALAELNANAALITAAPELVEALERTVQRLESEIANVERTDAAELAIDQARAALARARGQNTPSHT